jgi:putative MATE family efflux protein
MTQAATELPEVPSADPANVDADREGTARAHGSDPHAGMTRAIVALAWPIVALGLLRSCYYLAGAFFAGHLGEDAPAALSAIGGSSFALWILMCLSDLASVGTHAGIARAAGAGHTTGSRVTLTQGLWVGGLVSIALALFARPLTHAYFAAIGYQEASFAAALSVGTRYLEVSLLTAFTLVLHTVTDSAFRGVGDTRTPMLVSASTLLLNVALDAGLMLGKGPFPRLGLEGAAWAAAITHGLAFLVSLHLLRARGLGPSRFGPSLSSTLTILRIGAPQAFSGVGFCITYVFLGDSITRFGPSAMAALGLGHRIEGPSYQVCLGFAVAAATMVGQNLGRGSRERAIAAANRSAVLALVAMAPFTLAYLLAPRALVATMSTDPAIIDRGTTYIVAVGAATCFMALEVVYESAFAGAGDTTPAMLVLLPLTAVRVPLAAWIATHTSWGIGAIFWAIAASTAVKGVVLWLVFRWRSPRWT